MTSIRFYILVLLVGAGLSAFAAPDQPSYYFRVASSPQNTFYGVQTLTSWGGILTSGAVINTKGRFQVFSISTGKMLWEIDRVLTSDGAIIISNDGMDVVTVKPSIATRVSTNAVVLESASSQGDTIVVEFLHKGDVVKVFTLGALAFDWKAFKDDGGTSNVAFVDPSIQVNWTWKECPPGGPIGSNPIVAGDTLALSMLDRKVRVFRISSATLVATVSLDGDKAEIRRNIEKIAPELVSTNSAIGVIE